MRVSKACRYLPETGSSQVIQADLVEQIHRKIDAGNLTDGIIYFGILLIIDEIEGQNDQKGGTDQSETGIPGLDGGMPGAVRVIR